MHYGSDLIVEMMRSLGIPYAAFNPGATFRGIHDSLINYQDEGGPQIIECAHEEISVAIAHGFAKASGKPMAVLTHNVVGLMHAAMAIYNAWCDQAPMVILGGTGPMDISIRRPGIDWIHTALVQGNLVRDYVKWDDQPYSLAGATESLLRGYRISMTEPPGPVYICYDLAIQEEEVSEINPFLLHPQDLNLPLAPSISEDTVDKVADLLVRAKSPVIIGDKVGRDKKAFKVLIELAELLSIPVIEPEKRVNSLNFPTDHDLNLTGANEEILGSADLILALEVTDLFGILNKVDAKTRQHTSLVNPKTPIIDIGLKDGQKNSWIQAYQRYQTVDISIPSAVSEALPKLLKACHRLTGGKKEERRMVRRKELKARHKRLREGWLEAAKKGYGGKSISKSLLALLVWDIIKDEEWVLANGSLKGWAQKIWNFSDSEQWLGISGGAGLGYGIGASLGAALAYRDSGKLILNLQSDGDFLFTPSALWTAAHYSLPVLIIMDNNRSYNNSRSHQNIVAGKRGRSLERAEIGTLIDDPPVDYALLARSFGVYAEGPATTPIQVKQALERALYVVKNEKRPALVDIVTI